MGRATEESCDFGAHHALLHAFVHSHSHCVSSVSRTAPEVHALPRVGAPQVVPKQQGVSLPMVLDIVLDTYSQLKILASYQT